MLSFFKSNKKKTVKKGLAFYERESIVQTIDELIEVLSLLDSNCEINSKIPIQFQNKSLSSINKKTLDEDFGEESFILHPENNIDGHEVYFYRITSEHLRFLIQIHFINDNFFLASTKVYSDALLSQNDKNNVIAKINSKYCPNIVFDNPIIEVKDLDGNILWTKDDVFFYINYLHNTSICSTLKERYYGIGKPISGQEIKNTLDDLI